MRSERKEKIITFRIPFSLFEALKEMEAPISTLCRNALRLYLKLKHEQINQLKKEADKFI